MEISAEGVELFEVVAEALKHFVKSGTVPFRMPVNIDLTSICIARLPLCPCHQLFCIPDPQSLSLTHVIIFLDTEISASRQVQPGEKAHPT